MIGYSCAMAAGWDKLAIRNPLPMTSFPQPFEFVQGVRVVIKTQVQRGPFIFHRNDQRVRLPAAPVTPCSLACYFCNDPATPKIYTLSLHDALPITRSSVRSPAPASPEVW